jgi:TRAP-type mannitol/chloroaromatic compound transport system permease large subunit
MRTLFAGVTPFVVVDIVRLALLIAFPGIVLLLPRYLG